MNGKCILALILTLQVSMSLCDSPPSADLVEKYNVVKTRFYSRIAHIMNSAQAALLPYAESEQGAAVKSAITELTEKPEYKTLEKVLNGLMQELAPIGERLRMNALSRYEEHLRPYVGEFLNDFITQASPILDKYFPTE